MYCIDEENGDGKTRQSERRARSGLQR